MGGASRYLQYRAVLTTTDLMQTPALADVAFRYSSLPDMTPPTILSRSPTPGAVDIGLYDGVVVKLSELMNPATINASTVRLRQVGEPSDVPATVNYAGSTITLQPTTVLSAQAVYEVTLASAVSDASGNTLGTNVVWSFTTAWLTQGDTTGPDFSAGTSSGTTVIIRDDGEVTLSSVLNAEFSVPGLPADWTSTIWNTGSAASVSAGLLTVDGAAAHTVANFAPAHRLEFVGTFSGNAHQHGGFADFVTNKWAMFSTFTGDGLYARTTGAPGNADTLIPGNWFGAPHLFRIEWNASNVVYSIDGVPVASHDIVVGSNLAPTFSDFNAGAGSVVVDWVRLGPYGTSGTFSSRVFDAGAAVTWDSALWNATTPSGTNVAISVRMGNAAVPDANWTAWVPLSASGATIGGRSRYIQYRADLGTTDNTQTPSLNSVTFRYTDKNDTSTPAMVDRSPAPGTTNVDPTSAVTVIFSELMDTATINSSTVRLRQVGGSTDVPATVSYLGSTVTLQPAGTLSAQTQYQVTLSSIVSDVSGNSLGSDITWIFTTANPTPGNTLFVSGFPATTVAGQVHTLTVTAQDAFGDTLTSYSGTVHFTSSDLQAGLPTDYTFTIGDQGTTLQCHAQDREQPVDHRDRHGHREHQRHAKRYHRQPGGGERSVGIGIPDDDHCRPGSYAHGYRAMPTVTSPPGTPAPCTSPAAISRPCCLPTTRLPSATRERAPSVSRSRR